MRKILGIVVASLLLGGTLKAQDKQSLLSDSIKTQTMVLDSVTTEQSLDPVFKRKDNNALLQVKIYVHGTEQPLYLTQLDVNTKGTTSLSSLSNIRVFYTGNKGRFSNSIPMGDVHQPDKKVSVNGNIRLVEGVNNFWVSCNVDDSADLLGRVDAGCDAIVIDGKHKYYPIVKSPSGDKRIGVAVRKRNDDNVNTYRIPGLATTNEGTLIAVYDVRRKSGVDLQGDIDVGMSRSVDGGDTWEPMKVIMDLKEWGGKPQDENGIGDPCVLVDRKTNTIWVAAVWAHGHPGKRNWHASKPGMKPQQTSQFVLVKSEDDGTTWSDPINITSQIKDPKWQLLLQGPGKGITMRDGTLVFPAQFKDEKRMPHSTIIFSKDHGKTWKIGTGAKSNTTEAQVVELNDGSLMLNMRDNRGGSRSVYVTKDLGKTWQKHVSSRGALPEPVCMASLIKHNCSDKKSVLVFSNPATIKGRHNMTLKISHDDGVSWPEKYQTLYHQSGCYGYSCLTSIDKNTIGVLYEGGGEILFLKIPVDSIKK